MVDWPAWGGRTVVCIASGPSLTSEDCETVRASGHPVVVTNTTFRLCPWADALFGFDTKWWKAHHAEVQATFAGRRFCGTELGQKFGATWRAGFRNSGAAAVSLAMDCGAARVVLLGYDASFEDGRRHWHEDHPAGLENADTVADWPRQFGLLAKVARRRGVGIVNASRRTALTCFPRVGLEDSL